MRTAVGLLFLFLIASRAFAQPPAKTPDEGVLPVGADGRPLNLDFETGTLKDWTAEGEAFQGQPIKGDTVFPRRKDMHSRHQGDYWIGTYEKSGDKPQGTLTSVPFKVTHPWASFLVGGGPHDVTCVELVKTADKTVFHRSSGLEEEDMRRVVVDLKGLTDQEIFIRLVDRHTGHWGHINFDDFRFHTAKPNFPPRQGAPDEYKYAGLPPEKAAQVMKMPEGFDVKLFAGEPDVVQPIAMCLDDRGRVWVVEGRCYPIRRKAKGPDSPFVAEGIEGDRILIFEDTDGDGHFDKRTVFMDGLNLVSGIEVGFGGVWIGAAPYLLYVPMKDDKPAGEPKILLDGWGYQDTHETLNAFTWGPDGWLYGCHGVFTHSNVGKPGTPDDKRTKINAGVWRYHPTRHVFEVFAHGTSNPWGLDFNEYGQMFVEACVIPHCFHIIQGGRYNRQAGEHFNPYTYADIPTIADHLHWQGANPWAGNNRSDSMGGGHAHAGLMCYLGGAWPTQYRGQLFMGNIHGRRINMDIPRPKGSGYVAGHGPDFLLANDAWARFINMRYGPDGNVYVIDWYDKQACHSGDVKVWDRSNGRIYKVCYRGTKWEQVDLNQLSTESLAGYLWDRNEWNVRHARRLLQERGSIEQGIKEARMLFSSKNEAEQKLGMLKEIELRKTHKTLETASADEVETQRLRALWAFHATGDLDEDRLRSAMEDKSAYVRAWAIQFAVENGKVPPKMLLKLTLMARDDSSPVVHLYLASALQRLPTLQRWSIAEELLSHWRDANDQNLPLMYWYGVEPLAADAPSRALELAAKAKIPQILPFMVRRIGSSGTPEAIDLLATALAKADDAKVQLAFLNGVREALKGRPQVKMPAAWPDAFAKLAAGKDAQVRKQAVALAVTFGDVKAFDEMRKLVGTDGGDAATRQAALAVLLAAKDKQLAPMLHQLLAEPPMRGVALRGLAAYDDPQTPAAILGVYGKLEAAEKRDALTTLASRPAYARAMIDAIAAKKIAAADVPADIVRNLRNLKDAGLIARVADVWGLVRDTPAERAQEIARYKNLLEARAKRQTPDLALGRAIFAKTCQNCHKLFGVGGAVGPDITGANRADLGYLLENVLDPSAVIPKEYAATIIETKAGRVITGIVKGETPAALTVMTANETLTIPKDEIESRQPTKTSMMPDDQLKTMSDHEVRSLFAYLQSPVQTPILATAENAKDLFNGKDLTGWDGDPKLWSVDKGEIVGKSPGIAHNSFLRSQMLAADFKLSMQVKLTPDKENSGIQFRSEALPGYEVKGYQADVGAGWWGKLYEEHGRGVLSAKGGEAFVKAGEWNLYEIEAKGSRIRTWINGQLCVDMDDPQGAPRGIFALQIHSGGAMEVRFKELRLEVLR
jgi:putative membrane-bound dehydrogenase-like protein